MEKIALPKKIEFQAGTELNEGNIIIEPLFPGYGMTLGNSLRRVLLSSLPGAAVTGVKIKGASHEFMALENIKEDILEIILNLKQLRLKIHGEEEVKLDLSVSGKKIVTAADIAKNSQVEVVNPDLVLAQITDPAGNLEMEIYAKPGRGYQLSDTSEKGKGELGFIEVDAIFSPILSVSIENENVRVGKMTNWDKLILKVKTDGTITFEEAFNKSVEVLIDQFNALLPGALEVEAVEEPVAEVAAEEEVVETEEKPKTKKKK
ncbi:MAG TPA: DNA-directed RNA polymerase subunit alpha [bacterium]|nr:DNA-directed RNA polymerase subunit alpha [bacterium]HPT29956.1 DNA-directed RNA polymerase subunit alpha [bacterium]